MSEPLTEQELDIIGMAATDGDFGPHERPILRLLEEVRELRSEIERRNDDGMDYLTHD